MPIFREADIIRLGATPVEKVYLGGLVAYESESESESESAFLYDFTSFTFTSGTQTGHLGPSRSNLLSAYNTAANPWLGDTRFFDVAGGIQVWTVPQDGLYRINASGAQGGGGGTQNLGANIQGTFSLNKGEKISILVGHVGTGTAGGGGSFVVKQSGSTTQDIYVIAGGGGGKSAGSPGQPGNANSSGTVSNGNGGLANNGSWNGPAGGGFFTSGQVSIGSPRGSVGSGFLQGGNGGPNIRGDSPTSQAAGAGGFGGGGSGGGDSIAGGGAGGGYSGGSGGPDGSSGQGAGSFNSGLNQSNASGSNFNNGSVVITRL